MKLALLQHPAAPHLDEVDIAARIRKRVATHATGLEAGLLALLILRCKVDGPETKLARLLGLTVADTESGLRQGLARLRTHHDFRILFHLVRSTL